MLSYYRLSTVSIPDCNFPTVCYSRRFLRIIDPHRSPDWLPTNRTLGCYLTFYWQCTALATNQMPTRNECRPSPPHQADHTKLSIWNIPSLLICCNLGVRLSTSSSVFLLDSPQLPPLFPSIPIPETIRKDFMVSHCNYHVMLFFIISYILAGCYNLKLHIQRRYSSFFW